MLSWTHENSDFGVTARQVSAAAASDQTEEKKRAASKRERDTTGKGRERKRLLVTCADD